MMLHRGRFRRAQRGGSFLMTMLIAFPLMLLGLSFATDYCRLIYLNRQAADTAEVMAMAGATAFDPNNAAQFNTTMSRQRVQAMWNQAISAQMITQPTEVTLGAIETTPTRVAVTVNVRSHLLVPSILSRFAGRGDVWMTSKMTRSAAICIEGVNRGGCSYPVDQI